MSTHDVTTAAQTVAAATEPPNGAAGESPESIEVDLSARELYFNRELSWLEFNDRVLQIAENPDTPLLERARFLAIYASNLDEFFMVRVAGLHDVEDAGLDATGADGASPTELIQRARERVLGHGERHTRVWEGEVCPQLAEHGIRIARWEDLDEVDRASLTERYYRQIHPVLTPLAVGVGRPFPYISNLSLSLAVSVRDPETESEAFARVKVPTELLPRFVTVGDEHEHRFIPLEDVIAHHLDALFPGMEIIQHDMFRVTRDADFTVSDEADDLVKAVETELRRRRFGEVVRVEIGGKMSPALRSQLLSALEIEERELFEVDGMLDLTDLWQIVGLPGYADLRDTPWTPVTQPRLRAAEGEKADVFAAMREGDILVHHPYDSFGSSVQRFVEQAVADPAVLAIKQTVYRTSDDSPLVPALIRATEMGKQAVCVVEVKARFDEQANIQWARHLEEAGVHVVYGHPSLKTHAKCVLVVRREGDGVRHYVHVGTGNYHAKTARLYTDFGLFTVDERIGADVADMFNFLTGYGRPRRYRKALVAPHHLRDGILSEIKETIAAHSDQSPGRIRMKMNSLVDQACIEGLYRASQAGVKVEINVRGISCLRPGVEGVSENISVVSVVGRFLEHSRIYAFERNGEWTVYTGSADLMPRNLDTRVELVVPITDPAPRNDLLDTMERSLADDTDAWDLHADGTWTKRERRGSEPRSVQRELMLGHHTRAAELPAGA